MICPTCSWPMVTQEAKAGFLSSSCLSPKCARVCYIPLKEDGAKVKPMRGKFNEHLGVQAVWRAPSETRSRLDDEFVPIG